MDEQEGYLTVVYDKQDRVVEYATWRIAETPEEAIMFHEFCEVPFPEAVELDADSFLEYSNECERTSSQTEWMWQCLRAHRGIAGAQFKVALYYRRGRPPVSQDLLEAYKWFSLAATNGFYTNWWTSNDIGPQLTPDQLSEAESLVAEWEPNPAECEAGVASYVN